MCVVKSLPRLTGSCRGEQASYIASSIIIHSWEVTLARGCSLQNQVREKTPNKKPEAQ